MKIALVAAVAVSVLLAGCASDPTIDRPASTESSPSSTPSSTPTPEATRPSLSDLVMRPGGLDYLAVEVPIEPRDPELEIARYNAAACESDPNSIIGWESTFEGDTFQIVSLPDGRIRGILARSPEIRTAEGIGVGSSLAEVTDAYGSATMTEHAFTDTFTVSGADGILTIEVGSDRSDEYPAGEVLWMVATGSDSAGASFARTAYGPCV